MYYNNSGASDGQDVTGTWDGDFRAIYHMDDASGNIQDSTINNNDATAVANTPTFGQTGKIDTAVWYDGSGASDGDAFHTLPDFLSLAELRAGFTVSYWVCRHSDTQTEYDTLCLYDNGYVLCYMRENGGTLYASFYTKGGDNHWVYGTTEITKENWHYLTFSYDGTTKHVYTNGGDEQTGAENTIDSKANSNTLGADYNGHWGTEGNIDELRVSKICRSDAWIKASYHTVATSAFLTVGSEQTKPAGWSNSNPVNVIWQYPNGATDVSPLPLLTNFLIALFNQ